MSPHDMLAVAAMVGSAAGSTGLFGWYLATFGREAIINAYRYWRLKVWPKWKRRLRAAASRS